MKRSVLPYFVMKRSVLPYFGDTFLGENWFYIKVDIEGGEIDCLKGMNRLLTGESKPLFLSFEYALNWAQEFVDRPKNLSYDNFAGSTLTEEDGE
jgi:hypothetical protein